jgi:hypothetical protein
VLFFLGLKSTVNAQDYRWQQRVEYSMDVHLDVKTHKLAGTQHLIYYNNSNDTLRKVYYHLYYNAFQPGSMMDVRSRSLPDPDARVKDRISLLKENEIGYQRILSLKQETEPTQFHVTETILEVTLPNPILPHSKTTFEMQFEAQVPIQVRRTGRDNLEGIDYSMTQWYPKLAEYDHQGWHAYPYVAREFHGVWGDFDVKITLDHSYIVGATGVIQNGDETGYGYEERATKVKRKKGDLTWHFIAKNVHDFAWVADPDYTHEIVDVPGGPTLHFLYQKNEKTAENWKKLQANTVKHFQYMIKNYGPYPYEVYSVLQGGDRGMEYPMCTLITGERTLPSLTGTMAHEVSHSWFHGVLASNELLYHWMDEGFADFTSHESLTHILNSSEPPHKRSYASYFAMVKSGLQEPSSEHADFYSTNRAYVTASYAMGTIFLEQLKYIMGEEKFYSGMKRYYMLWQFRHPEPNDFLRVMEKESGMELKWFYNYWINTTKHIDYGIDSVAENKNGTTITLKRIGELPMPIEMVVTLRDGSKELYYIPLNETLGRKSPGNGMMKRIDLDKWNWVDANYKVELHHPKNGIAKIEIDSNQQLADIDRTNNVLILKPPTQGTQSE